MLCLTSAIGQTLDDALRLSEIGTFGTARSLGTGNSMGAIGAEWTAVQSNPAGLAAFRRNELSITLGGIRSATSDATISTLLVNEDPRDEASTRVGGDFRVALPQLAAVFTREPIGSRWTQFNFGVGVSQTRRHEESVVFGGFAPGSITDRFIETANDGANAFAFVSDDLLLFDERPAFETGAIFETDEDAYIEDYLSRLRRTFGDDAVPTADSVGVLWASDYDFLGRRDGTDPGADIEKIGEVSRRGYNAGVDLSFGANYDEKLLLGATFGIVNYSFEESNLYREIDSRGEVPVFDELTWIEATNSSGSGVLGRFGAIYRASQALRIGLAYHTPTLTFVDQSYSTQLTYRFTDSGEANEATAASEVADQIEYRFRSPAQLRASASLLIGNRGFISAELARINYAGSRFTIDEEFDPTGEFGDDLNDIIESTLRPNYQFRLGGELNLSPVQVRLGYEYTGTPLEAVDGITEDPTQRFSAGIGWRPGRFGLDLGYQLTRSADRIYRPYTVETLDFPQPIVTYTPTLSTFALTVAYKLGRR